MTGGALPRGSGRLGRSHCSALCTACAHQSQPPSRHPCITQEPCQGLHADRPLLDVGSQASALGSLRRRMPFIRP